MSFQWSPPTKKIVIASDIPRFKRSIGYKNLNLAIASILEKMKGIDIPKGYLDPKIVTRELDVTEVAPKLELQAPVHRSLGPEGLEIWPAEPGTTSSRAKHVDYWSIGFPNRHLWKIMTFLSSSMNSNTTL